jgi:hypothetical protein
MHEDRTTKPEEIWTLEGPTRAITDRATQAHNNETVKKILGE